MILRRPFLGGCFGGFVTLFEPCPLIAPSLADSKVTLAVVTKKEARLDGLSLRELKRLFLGGAVEGPDGKLIPLNQAQNSPDRVGFERVVLNMSGDEAGRYWIDRKIRGQSGPPKSVASPELLRRAVASIPGTISYIRTHEVGVGLKVLSVDDKRPMDPGYALEY